MNGLTRRFSESVPEQLEKSALTLLGGILLGIFVLAIFQLPMKFTYFLVGGSVLLFVAVLSGRFKRFFQNLLIFIIPLNYSTHFFRRPYLFGEKGLPFSPLDIIIILLYGIWIYELLLKRSHNFRLFPQITIPSMGLVLIALLGMFPAPDPYFALFEAIQILKSFLLCFYVANHVRDRRDLQVILVIVMVGLFIQSSIAMAQKWLGVSLGLQLFGEYQEQTTLSLTHEYYITVARVGGTIGHPNNLAKYIELLIPLPAVLLFTRIRLRSKLAAAVVFLCAFIVLLISLSRGGWVSFVGSMGLVLLLIFRAGMINLRTLVAFLVVAAILLGVTLGFSSLVSSRLFGDDYGAAEGRVPLNRIAINVIKAYPILGVGAQNYWKVMDRYNPNIEFMRANIVHNAYLLTAAEMGLLGLFFLLWLYVALFVAGMKNIRVRQDVFLKCLNIGCLAGLAALWAHWLVDPGYIGRIPMMWVLASMIMATRKVPENSDQPLATG